MPQPPTLRPWQRATLVLAPLLILLVFGAVLLATMLERRASTERVQATYQRLSELHGVRARVVDAESGQRGFLITGDSTYLEPYREAEREALAILERLHGSADVHPEQYARLEALVGERFERLRLALDARGAGFEPAREQVVAGRGIEAMASLRATLRALEAEEQAQLAREVTAQEVAGTNALLALGIGILLVLFTSGYTHRYLSRHGRALERANRELDTANLVLQEQALELEMQTQELQLQSAQLEENAEELQNINAELEQRTHEAEAANSAKTAFLRSMSHELRTPLNAIDGYTDLLQLGVQGTLSEAQRTSIERIKANSRHLLVLINDILSFARLEAGHIELHLEHVPVHEVLEQTSAQLRPLLTSAELELHVADVDPGLTLHADADRTRQILLNLLVNAIRHAGTGCHIALAATAADAQVTIQVLDDGPGIPLELQQAIFDPFVQAPKHAGALNSGAGLGLAISRELARSMGGDLTLVSTPGQGACFLLVLPRSILVHV